MKVVDLSRMNQSHLEIQVWLIQNYGLGSWALRDLEITNKYKWAWETVDNRDKIAFANEEIYTRFMLTWI